MKRACKARIERDSGSEPLLVADEHSSSCWKGKAERVQLGDLLRLGSCVLHPPLLPLLTNNDMLKGTAVKMSLCLAIVLKEERRGAYCSSHTHTDALNHSWQKGPSLLMCVKRLQGFCDFVFVMLLHFELNFTRVALLICDYKQVPHHRF